MPRFNFIKDPNAELDWQFNWSDWLAIGETISSASFAVDDGLTVNSTGHDDTLATIWVSGGTAGKVYRVTCHIVTSDSRTDDRSINIRVMER
jgi:hypothetical protein